MIFQNDQLWWWLHECFFAGVNISISPFFSFWRANSISDRASVRFFSWNLVSFIGLAVLLSFVTGTSINLWIREIYTACSCHLKHQLSTVWLHPNRSIYLRGYLCLAIVEPYCSLGSIYIDMYYRKNHVVMKLKMKLGTYYFKEIPSLFPILSSTSRNLFLLNYSNYSNIIVVVILENSSLFIDISWKLGRNISDSRFTQD